MSENLNLTPANQTIINKLEESEPQLKKFSWTPFALALLCFFLPFLEVSCQGKKLASLSGLQTAFGTQISSPTAFGAPQVQEIPGVPMLVLVLLITIACLIIPFIKFNLNHLTTAIASAFSLFLLLMVKWNVDNESLKQGGGMLVIEVGFGYILIFVSLLIGMASHGFLHHLKKQKIIVQEPLTITEPKTQTDFTEQEIKEFDLVGWIGKNKILLMIAGSALSSLVIFGTFFYGSFRLFFAQTPESDAKYVTSSYCQCEENYNSKLISIKKNFLNSFDSAKFKTREEAEEKLLKLENVAEKDLSVCNSQANVKYTELKNKYLANKSELQRFESLFEAQKGTCNPSNQTELSDLSDDLEKKISTIKIAEVIPVNRYSQPQNVLPEGKGISSNYVNSSSEESEDVATTEPSVLGCQKGQSGYFTGGNVRTSPQHSQNVQNIIAVVDPNAELRILETTTGEPRQSTGNVIWYKVKFINGVCHLKQNFDLNSCEIQNLPSGFVNADLVLGCK